MQSVASRDQKSLGQSRWGIDADEADRSVARGLASENRGRIFHLVGMNKGAGARRCEEISVGSALDQLLADALFQGRDAAGDRTVVDPKCAGHRSKAAVANQGREYADIFPIKSCAFLRGHGA